MNIAFTVTNYAYLHKALALKESFENYNNFKLNIYLFEEETNITNCPFEDQYEFISIFNFDRYYELAFKYDVTELTTSLKPSITLSLLKKFKNVIFLDPDTYIYKNFDYVLNKLKNNSILLTPHRLKPEKNDKYSDLGFVKYGVYNLGFFAVNNSNESQSFLRWWEEKCLNQCYFETQNGLSTDQKWINIAQCFFEKIEVLRNPGLNVAYWNIDERNFDRKDSDLFVNNEDLVFFHFSNFPKEIDSKLSSRSDVSFKDLDSSEIIKSIFTSYKKSIDKYLDKLNLTDYVYSYDKLNEYYLTQIFKRYYGMNINIFEGNPFKSKKLFQFGLRNKLLSKKPIPKIYNESNVTKFKLKILIKIFRFLIKLVGSRNFVNLSRLLIFFSSPHRIKDFYK